MDQLRAISDAAEIEANHYSEDSEDRELGDFIQRHFHAWDGAINDIDDFLLYR